MNLSFISILLGDFLLDFYLIVEQAWDNESKAGKYRYISLAQVFLLLVVVTIISRNNQQLFN